MVYIVYWIIFTQVHYTILVNLLLLYDHPPNNSLNHKVATKHNAQEQQMKKSEKLG